jgi:hypothetical protein
MWRISGTEHLTLDLLVPDAIIVQRSKANPYSVALLGRFLP